ncbi:hypothetical protein EBT25_12970 [bacterium]|nr:hypothetical protein [bacterium]
MTTEHRKAPRRKVVEINKTGTWGNIQYTHVLECGHREKRARAATSKELACVMCLRMKDKELEMTALAKPKQISAEYDVDVNSKETIAQMMRAGIAANLKIPHEAIDVVMRDNNGNLEISSVVLFLSAADASRIAGLAR